MIIWGFRVIYRTLSTGVFHCPKEDADRNYKLRMAQRFFTLFFIPLIPLKKLGAVVECEGCGTRFEERVLSSPTLAQKSENLASTVRATVVSVLRAGAATPVGREQAVRTVNGYLPSYDDAQLSADLPGLDTSDVRVGLRNASSFLDDHGKEGLLTRFALVGLGEKGFFTDAERAILTDIGGDLGMTATHSRGVLDAAIDLGRRS
jgi:hypothetical protein